MGAHDHKHDDGHSGGHVDATSPPDDGLPPSKPRQYWESTPSRRARPQFDPAEVAKAYLDSMEKGGRLHLTRKRDAPPAT
jgi:hypothetical protein